MEVETVAQDLLAPDAMDVIERAARGKRDKRAHSRLVCPREVVLESTNTAFIPAATDRVQARA